MSIHSESYSLDVFHTREDDSHIESRAEMADALTEEAPDNAATDQRPTKAYQTALLISGFLMTFHIIGINFIYGIFQVSLVHIGAVNQC